MRRIAIYIHQLKGWPKFTWDGEKLARALTAVRHRQGKLTGRMEALGFNLRSEASLQTLTLDVLKSSEIEGEMLNADQVRSSIARRLGMNIAGLVAADRHVEGIVKMMLDATQHYQSELTAKRLFAWHASMFPGAGRKMKVGTWRDNTGDDPMQVISGPMGRERVHYEAPASGFLEKEMEAFLDWFNGAADMDPVLKAGIAHLWFVTVHPFDDGNGRIARAIADLQLARSDESRQRFYSMSAQIRKERSDYYGILETTQKGTLDITAWLEWFLACLDRSLTASEETLEGVMKKAKFWEEHGGARLNPRQQLMLNKLFDNFDGKLTSSKWAKMAKCSHDTALRDIHDLVNQGVLVKDPAGGRSTNYLVKG